jgi:peptide/nickel transport system permease protein
VATHAGHVSDPVLAQDFRQNRLIRVATWSYKTARRKPLGTTGLVILLVFIGGAAFAPMLATHHYAETDLANRLQGPSAAHWFGTDNLGRDLYSRILYGARVSLGIALLAVIWGKGLATAIAVVSGYYGGWLDKIVQRVVDVWIALPSLILIITIAGMVDISAIALGIIIGAANAPYSSRVIRSIVLSVREEPYVEAARSIGAKDYRIIFLYILPNITHLIIYTSTVALGSTILIVASLGFLGYGVPPPHPDLGAMLSGEGLSFMRRNPWMAAWPGLVITLAVFAFNVFGDALRDLFDPRLRGR